MRTHKISYGYWKEDWISCLEGGKTILLLHGWISDNGAD